jgi:hypothetical protein
VTLVEFLAPLKAGSHGDRVLAVLYYKARYEGHESQTAQQIRAALKAARAPRARSINIADVLNKSGAYVDSPGSVGPARLWKLTDTGKSKVRELLKLPEADLEVENDVGTLTALAMKVKDPEVRDYIDESITCLRAGALRASVVFLWSGATRTIQNELVASGLAKLNNALQKHDPKAREVRRVEDFAYIKDDTMLLAAVDLARFDKNQGAILKEALGLRNKSGHPGDYKPGPKKVSSFIEDVIGIVFK